MKLVGAKKDQPFLLYCSVLFVLPKMSMYSFSKNKMFKKTSSCQHLYTVSVAEKSFKCGSNALLTPPRVTSRQM